MAKTKERQHAPATTDPRFARLHTDPRFLRPQKDEAKVKVDDRFKGMLDGTADFGVHKRGGRVDRFGRKAGKGGLSKKQEEEMKRLYKMDRDSDGEDDDEDDREGSASDEADGDEEESASAGKSMLDYARGAVDLESSGSEDEDEDEASSSDDSDEDQDVAIGSAAVLRRERRRQRNREESSSDSEEDSEDDDETDQQARDAEARLVGDLDPRAFAALDAQAARIVAAESGFDDEAGPSSSRSTSAKRDSRKAKRQQQQQKMIEPGSETRRLAVVNMDWDHVRALDLYKVFSSLVSPLATRLPGPIGEEDGVGEDGGSRQRRTKSSVQVKGSVESVRVYPSDFGRERMRREDIEGPPKDIFKSGEPSDGISKKSRRSKGKGKKGKRRGGDSESESDEDIFQINDGGDFDEEALRKYQLERLRYYYAIATFDSPATARYVYDAVDGAEMERTANIFDLQFVPDEMEFSDRPAATNSSNGADGGADGDQGWRDEARPGLDDGVTYRGADWATDALRHSKVKLTWDAPDPERMKVMSRRKGLTKDQIRDEDFKAYLATDSEGGSSDDDDDGGDADLDASRGKGKKNAAGKGAAATGKDGGRDRFRALMGLDDNEGSNGRKGNKHRSAFEDARASDDEDDDGSNADSAFGEGDMEITFMPGLSEAAAARSKARAAEGTAGDKEEREETTLEKYMRKQREKKQRRKEAAAARAEGGAEVEGESAVTPKVIGGGGGAVAKTSTDKEGAGFDDPFFASDGDSDGDDDSEDIDYDAMLAREREVEAAASAASTKGKKSSMAATASVRDDADEEEDEDGRTHFSLADILKAQNGKVGADGKKKKLNRWEKKKLAKLAKAQQQQQQQQQAAGQDGGAMDAGPGIGAPRKLEAQENFVLDVADPRFAGALLGSSGASQHEFAVDPSHPSFLNTEGSKRMLAERRKRAAAAADDDARAQATTSASQQQLQSKRTKASSAAGKEGTAKNESKSMGSGDDPASLLRSLKARQQQQQQQQQNGNAGNNGGKSRGMTSGAGKRKGPGAGDSSSSINGGSAGEKRRKVKA